MGIFSIFFKARGVNPWLVLGCLLVAALFEGIGYAAALPLLQLMFSGGVSVGEETRLHQIITSLFDFLGLQFIFENLLIVMFVVFVIKGIILIITMRYAGYATARVATGLRSAMLHAILQAKWSYFVNKPAGSITNMVSIDATRAGQAYLHSANLVILIIQAAVVIAVAYLTSPRLFLFAIFVGGAIAGVLHILVIISKKAGHRQVSTTHDLVMYLTDALRNIKPLKSMNRQRGFEELFAKRVLQLKKALRRQVISDQARISLEEIFQIGFICVAAYFSYRLWEIPVERLLIIGVVLQQALKNIGKIQRKYQSAVVLASAYWQAYDLVEEAEQAAEDLSGTKIPKLEQHIVFDNVSFSFPGKPVLEAVSLKVPTGKITVLAGPSGSGKTTITDLIIGLYRADSGRVMLDDIPLEDIDIARWRSQIGYVAQELVLFHDSVRANITLGDQTLSQEDIIYATELAGIRTVVDALPEGLDTVLGEGGARLSGGQRQRVALARALVTRPGLLILDEVTSALDPETEQNICNQIKTLKGTCTILVITHRPAWIEIADRVYQVVDGRVLLEKNEA